MSIQSLSTFSEIIIKQRKELAEFVGFETRNKYEVLTSSNQSLFYIAENQKGVLGFFLRQMVGHWRSFDLGIFNSERKQIAIATHPFRFLFPELHVSLLEDYKSIGYSKKRFSILSKKYSIHLPNNLEYRINSGLFSPWTFNITKDDRIVATIKKRWSGGLKEFLTDADNFLIEFKDQSLDNNARFLLLLLVVLIDLNHFENKN